MIYLDNSATSFIKPKCVKKVVSDAIENLTANPGRSGHDLATNVAQKIYETRENVKRFLGAKSYDLIFTKNCTEALNLAIFSTLKSGDHVIVSCYEHNSVLRPLNRLKNEGVEVEILWCSLADFANEFETKIKEKTKLVITTYLSNTTGEICDVFTVGKICRNHNIKYLIDGAQACGYLSINLEKINADFFAFAGHKGLLSLTGVGGLIVRNLKDLKPIILGGTGTVSGGLDLNDLSVDDFEAGTISSISIISLNSGVSYMRDNFLKILEKERFLSEKLYKNMKKIKNLEIYSPKTSTIVLFNIINNDSASVANELNEKYKICVRAGYHCAPLIHEKLKTNGAVRASLNFNNTEEEINYFCRALNEIANGK